LSERRYNGLVEPEKGCTFLRPAEDRFAKCSRLDGDRVAEATVRRLGRSKVDGTETVPDSLE